MAKPKTYFEQVPIETVKRIAKLDLPEVDEIDARSVKEERQVARRVSEKQVIPGLVEL